MEIPFDSPKTEGPVKQLSIRQAKKALIREFIRALRKRPHDFKFESTGRYVLEDTKTTMRWWIANNSYGFHLRSVGDCSCREMDQFGFIGRCLAYSAFQKWERQYATPPSPYIHEAERLIAANADLP